MSFTCPEPPCSLAAEPCRLVQDEQPNVLTGTVDRNEVHKYLGTMLEEAVPKSKELSKAGDLDFARTLVAETPSSWRLIIRWTPT